MANIKITTGQHVNVEQRMASVGDRIYAQILDTIFISIYFVIITTLVGMLASAAYFAKNTSFLAAILFLAYLPIVIYHPVSEFFFNGASPGKKILKLQVVKIDGSAPSLGDYLTRWAMYLIECLIMPGIALLCILFNKNGQRLGDLMAGTVVIKRDGYQKYYFDLSNFNYVNPGYKPRYPEAATLSMRQAEVIRQTLVNNNANRHYYIDLLSNTVRQYLNIPPLEGGNNEAFLNTILNDYRFYSSTIEI
jgi:uncharacterized RDD family membrane protein YckC